MRSRQPLVALVTCDQFPDLADDDKALRDALVALDIAPRVEVWSNRAALWTQYDLVVIRSTWDYAKRRAEFLNWSGAVSKLANPRGTVEWNSDKHYLQDLEAVGIPVVPTTWMEIEQHLDAQRLHTRFPAGGEFVLKPAVSGGVRDTGRYTSNDAISRGLAIKHASRLLNSGRAVMLQRYLSSVDLLGETALVYFDGEYSHAFHKGAMLTGPDTGEDSAYHTEKLSASDATPEQRSLAEKALGAAAAYLRCHPADFAYARIDTVADDVGTPMLMELELIEPRLCFGLAPGSAERFAKVLKKRIR